MAQEKDEKSGKEIQVEDLLRLKRHERPDDAFWGKFDRELHQQMLRTLVKKDPWYTQIARGFSGQFGQGIGIVTAALALMFVGVRSTMMTVGDERAPDVSQQASVSEAPIEAPTSTNRPVEVAARELSYEETVQSVKTDYTIDSIGLELAQDNSNIDQDFSMISFQVAGYDDTAYSGDSVQSSRLTFGAAGVASLVY